MVIKTRRQAAGFVLILCRFMIIIDLCHVQATWFIFWCKSFDLLLNLPISLDILGEKKCFVNVVNLWYLWARGALMQCCQGRSVMAIQYYNIHAVLSSFTIFWGNIKHIKRFEMVFAAELELPIPITDIFLHHPLLFNLNPTGNISFIKSCDPCTVFTALLAFSTLSC